MLFPYTLPIAIDKVIITPTQLFSVSICRGYSRHIVIHSLAVHTKYKVAQFTWRELDISLTLFWAMGMRHAAYHVSGSARFHVLQQYLVSWAIHTQ